MDSTSQTSHQFKYGECFLLERRLYSPALKAGQDFNCALKVVQSETAFLDISMTVVSIVPAAIPAILGNYREHSKGAFVW